MTILDTKFEQNLGPDLPNPYAVDVRSLEYEARLGDLIRERKPYVDRSSNPDIGTRAVYMIEGNDYFSDLARSLEGNVLKDRKDWGQDPSETQAESAIFELNSKFFVLVDKQTESGKAEIVGSLRIADCNRGPSETKAFYKLKNPDKELPAELKLDNDRRVWDIVSVVIDHASRNGLDSAWLYYAMHRNSLELGIDDWISNITDKEIKNLRRFIGIPFVEMEGTDKASVINPLTGENIDFGFYHTAVDVVADKVEEHIDELENKNGVIQKIAKVAMIGLWGSYQHPTEEVRSLAS